MLSPPRKAAVVRVETCSLRLGNAKWAYAESNRADIEAHWQSAKRANPHFFDGAIYLIDELHYAMSGIHGTVLKTTFKNYLYWRNAGFPEAGVRDGFGSALIWSSDGALLLGRQREGNVNGGLYYPPSGFIDGHDVTPNGDIDMAASIAREIVEETGMPADELTPPSGFFIAESGAQLAIAAAFVARDDAQTLIARVERHIAGDPKSELTGVAAVRQPTEIETLAMPPYARLLLPEVLSAGPG